MDKKLARKHDQFLTFLTGAKLIKNEFNHQELVETGQEMKIDKLNSEVIIDVLVTDGILDRKEFSHKQGTFYEYSVTPKLRKFVFDDGGYKRRRRDKYFETSNLKFTFIRHWIWFIGFLISVLLNLYLLV